MYIYTYTTLTDVANLHKTLLFLGPANGCSVQKIISIFDYFDYWHDPTQIFDSLGLAIGVYNPAKFLRYLSQGFAEF